MVLRWENTVKASTPISWWREWRGKILLHVYSNLQFLSPFSHKEELDSCLQKASLPCQVIDLYPASLCAHLPALQVSYQQKMGSSLRWDSVSLSVSKLMVTIITLPHLFSSFELKLKMHELNNLDVIDRKDELLSVSRPVVSPSDTF